MYKKEKNQTVNKNVGKTDQFVNNMSFLNFRRRKNKNMTQPRKQGKKAVGLLRLNLKNTPFCDVSKIPRSAMSQTYPALPCHRGVTRARAPRGPRT